MRDFKARDVNGDVNIIDHSNNNPYKLLIHCDNDELVLEEVHRIKLLKAERKSKFHSTLKRLVICTFIFLFAAVWYYINDKMDAVSAVTGIGSLFIGIASLSKADQPTEFEQRQLNALNEINTLLRERNVR
ncbi:hypothetical protein [Phytobacter sp. SCO41]|uniref:SMODS and SLOG-associating 2TM effector domain-containing protein n=1 Tax=Citrobacter bitternis TaxID=1585982 RepID=A0ABW1PYM6_9ENTR|nr:hypothetical protein [Phytobacter sp. SCO41]